MSLTPDPLLRIRGDARAALALLAPGSVHACCTSPPYWGLRAYDSPPQAWGGRPDCPHEWGDAIPGRDIPPRPDHSNGVPTGTRGARAGSKAKGFARTHGADCLRCGAWRGELGQEPAVALYVAHLVEVFAAVWRVLRDDGTLWVNLGDSYSSGGRRTRMADPKLPARGAAPRPDGGKEKDRLLVPPRMAIALQDWGWHVRDEIVWHKPSCMPGSYTDRTTAAHEMVYVFSKRPHYFYDRLAIAERSESAGRIPGGRKAATPAADLAAGRKPGAGNTAATLQEEPVADRRNCRSVWRIPNTGYKGAHFACWPPKLVRRMILAATSEHGSCPACGAQYVRRVAKVRTATRPGIQSKAKVAVIAGRGGKRIGNRDPERHVTTYQTLGWDAGCDCPPAPPVGAVVLDPFGGSGTTAAEALQLGRRAVLVDVHPDYQGMQARRIRETVGPLYLPAVPEPVAC